ncbi:MAG: hypothetical protein IJX63_04835 [Lachnospiraceae bacterium]|nr:hypothetical protein [Lachnospiraceae bacterium]
MRNKEKGGTKIVNFILNLVIVVLCFFFVMTAGVMIGEFYQAFTPGYSTNSFYYKIDDERYYSMVGAYHSNTQAGFEGDEDMQEYYGVAKYFEAASLYHAYQVAGNEEMAELFSQKMKLAEEEMGGWSVTREPILKYLGIEE